MVIVAQTKKLTPQSRCPHKSSREQQVSSGNTTRLVRQESLALDEANTKGKLLVVIRPSQALFSNTDIRNLKILAPTTQTAIANIPRLRLQVVSRSQGLRHRRRTTSGRSINIPRRLSRRGLDPLKVPMTPRASTFTKMAASWTQMDISSTNGASTSSVVTTMISTSTTRPVSKSLL